MGHSKKCARYRWYSKIRKGECDCGFDKIILKMEQQKKRRT